MSTQEGMSQEVPQRAEAMSIEVQRVPEVSAQDQQLIEREKMLDQELAALPDNKVLKRWEVSRFLMLKRSDRPAPSMTVQKVKEVIAFVKKNGEFPESLFAQGESEEALHDYRSLFVGPWFKENVQLCTNRVHQLERQKEAFLDRVSRNRTPLEQYWRQEMEYESRINFERYQFWESSLPHIPALESLHKTMNSFQLHFSDGFVNWSEPGGQHSEYMKKLRINLKLKYAKLLPKECR